MTNPWEEAAKEHEHNKAALHNSNKRNAELLLQVRTGEATIEALRTELDNAKARSDHYLRLYVEITKNLNTIGLVVDDTLRTYNLELGKGNGQVVDQHVKAVEHALADMRNHNEPVQHENRSERRPSDNEVHGRPRS